jgi:hypothetical protein
MNAPYLGNSITRNAKMEQFALNALPRKNKHSRPLHAENDN